VAEASGYLDRLPHPLLVISAPVLPEIPRRQTSAFCDRPICHL
jgi:hypothetical protein